MASQINASNSGFGGVVTTGDSSGVLQLQTASTTAVTIDTSQNVGIGTTSPGVILDAYRSSSSSDTVIRTTNPTANANSYFSSSNGSYQMNVGMAGTTYGGYHGIGANAGFVWATGPNGLSIIADQAAPIIFYQNAGLERMRIDSSGKVLINTTSTTGGGVTAGLMNLVSSADFGIVLSMPSGNYQAIRFVDGTTAVGSINLTTSSTAYGTSSDYRLKENIAPMTGALDKVAQLKPVTYTWKIDGSDGQGFIAHELQEIVSDCVIGEKDAINNEGNPVYQNVDTSFLVATLTAAIQEQQTIINDLKARIETLESK